MTTDWCFRGPQKHTDMGCIVIPLPCSAAGYATESTWGAILSSTALLWWCMGCGWVATFCSILSILLTYYLSFETVSPILVVWCSHFAITNTYITGFVYRTALLVRPLPGSLKPSVSSALFLCASCCCFQCVTAVEIVSMLHWVDVIDCMFTALLGLSLTIPVQQCSVAHPL